MRSMAAAGAFVYAITTTKSGSARPGIRNMRPPIPSYFSLRTAQNWWCPSKALATKQGGKTDEAVKTKKKHGDIEIEFTAASVNPREPNAAVRLWRGSFACGHRKEASAFQLNGRKVVKFMLLFIVLTIDFYKSAFLG
ncbi:hypothetical protein [Paracoccus sp. S1E-3]|uniref:hypothetical protein n=2 Tax=Paracoccus TaxID=265 RepID=UPI0015EF935C|nr:hypothetical protein [Paracoccus sp. S1E-3]MBA4491342.1 hypothetical protein [Paracoccus sp. S1E-3]